MSSKHKLKKCSDVECYNTTTKIWCKSCGYKNRKLEVWNKGIPCSIQTKEKISKTKTGVKNPKHSEWLKSNPNRFWLGKKRPDIQGSNNNMWKGDNVGYRALHLWVEKKLGRPNRCEHCGSIEAKRFEWANKSHKYKRDINDWLRLCTKCHREYDKC